MYPKPYATAFNNSNTGTFPIIQGETGLGQTVLFEHEVGTDQVNPDGTTTTVPSFIQSFDIDLEARQRDSQGRSSGQSVGIQEQRQEQVGWMQLSILDHTQLNMTARTLELFQM